MPERSKASGVSRVSGPDAAADSFEVSGILVVDCWKPAAPVRGGYDSVASNAAGCDGTPTSGLSRSRSRSPTWLSRIAESAPTELPYCDGTGMIDCGSVLAPSGSTKAGPSLGRSGAPPAW